MFQYRKKNQGSDASGKSAVVQHETSMEGACGGAHGSAHKACHNSGPDTVAPYDGAETGCKSHSVNVSLGGKGPGKIKVSRSTDRIYQNIEKLITQNNRPYIPRMLSHGRKGQGGQDDAYCRACKPCPLRKVDGQIQIQKKQTSVTGDIDETERHAVLVREIAGVPGVLHQMAESPKASVI